MITITLNITNLNDSLQVGDIVYAANTATQTAQGAQANLKIGGATAPYFAIDMQATQFSFPTHTIEDVIGISAEFLAQETTAQKGAGANVTFVTQAA